MSAIFSGCMTLRTMIAAKPAVTSRIADPMPISTNGLKLNGSSFLSFGLPTLFDSRGEPMDRSRSDSETDRVPLARDGRGPMAADQKVKRFSFRRLGLRDLEP